MIPRGSIVAAAALATLILAPGIAHAQKFSAKLSGFDETPSILSNGTGTLALTLGSTTLTYTLTYSGLSTDAHFSHIHFAKSRDPGAVIVFLCGGGGKPACPPGGGTVTGTITAADVLGVPAQGVPAGDFAALGEAFNADAAYANVHTTNFPAGEIRGQIRRGELEEE
jgi:hypothetical protein